MKDSKIWKRKAHFLKSLAKHLSAKKIHSKDEIKRIIATAGYGTRNAADKLLKELILHGILICDSTKLRFRKFAADPVNVLVKDYRTWQTKKCPNSSMWLWTARDFFQYVRQKQYRRAETKLSNELKRRHSGQ